MGTRFVATQDAPVHPNVKDAIVAAPELDTRLVMRPLRNTERVLVNAGVERLIAKERELGAAITFQDIAPEVAGTYSRIFSAPRGATSTGTIWPTSPSVGRWRRPYR